MRNTYSVIRLILCYALCLVFLFYSFFSSVILKPKISPTFTDISENSSQNSASSQDKTSSEANIQSKPQENASSKEEAVSSNSSAQNNSAPASTAAIKGKVVTRYISPYTVNTSYNKVYLKNYTSEKIDIKSLLNKKLGFAIKKNSEPQVLIMHTHTTECFLENDDKYYTEDFNSRTTNNSKNMAKIGDIIAKKLNDNGINTLHDKTKHDYPEYTGSYNRAAKTINYYLNKYPSIKIVLDLHRDAVSSDGGKAKLVTEIGGKKAAQVMLVMGSQTGGITEHPHWKENLSLAFKLQQTIETKYPTLARPLMLMSKKYNQSLSTGSLLIEFGTDVNTLSEACYSAELVGDSLVSLLNTLK